MEATQSVDRSESGKVEGHDIRQVGRVIKEVAHFVTGCTCVSRRTLVPRREVVATVGIQRVA